MLLYTLLRMHVCFVVFVLVLQYLAKRLAGKQWCSPRDHSLGLEAPRGQRIKSWSWGKSLGLGLGLDKKVWRIRIYKTGDSHDAGSCPLPAKVTKTSLFASHRKPLPSAEKAAVPLTSIVSSYLAYVQLILDGTQVSTAWRLVKDNKQFACLQWLFQSVFCSAHSARQHRLSVFSAMGVCSSGLIDQGCLTSFCVISCWQSATGSDKMCYMRWRFSVIQHYSFWVVLNQTFMSYTAVCVVCILLCSFCDYYIS